MHLYKLEYCKNKIHESQFGSNPTAHPAAHSDYRHMPKYIYHLLISIILTPVHGPPLQ